MARIDTKAGCLILIYLIVCSDTNKHNLVFYDYKIKQDYILHINRHAVIIGKVSLKFMEPQRWMMWI